jgi:hypothetical protein
MPDSWRQDRKITGAKENKVYRGKISSSTRLLEKNILYEVINEWHDHDANITDTVKLSY